jgi:hypothetical protein
VQRQFAFDRLAQILHEMKPVGYLSNRGRCRAGRFGVAAVPISTDHLDLGMGHQPLLDGLGGMLIHHVDHGVSFQSTTMVP